jgi:hypothetical protein
MGPQERTIDVGPIAPICSIDIIGGPKRWSRHGVFKVVDGVWSLSVNFPQNTRLICVHLRASAFILRSAVRALQNCRLLREPSENVANLVQNGPAACPGARELKVRVQEIDA